jgi:hypothetical protein
VPALQNNLFENSPRGAALPIKGFATTYPIAAGFEPRETLNSFISTNLIFSGLKLSS